MLKTPITHFFLVMYNGLIYIYIYPFIGDETNFAATQSWHPVISGATSISLQSLLLLLLAGSPRGVSAGKIWGLSKNGDTQQPWVFLLKLIILEMFLGYHHLRKHPYINQLSQNDEMFDVLLSLSLCVLLVGKLNCCLLQVVQQVLLASL